MNLDKISIRLIASQAAKKVDHGRLCNKARLLQHAEKSRSGTGFERYRLHPRLRTPMSLGFEGYGLQPVLENSDELRF